MKLRCTVAYWTCANVVIGYNPGQVKKCHCFMQLPHSYSILYKECQHQSCVLMKTDYHTSLYDITRQYCCSHLTSLCVCHVCITDCRKLAVMDR
jgi:hypothetical protein